MTSLATTPSACRVLAVCASECQILDDCVVDLDAEEAPRRVRVGDGDEVAPGAVDVEGRPLCTSIAEPIPARGPGNARPESTAFHLALRRRLVPWQSRWCCQCVRFHSTVVSDTGDRLRERRRTFWPWRWGPAGRRRSGRDIGDGLGVEPLVRLGRSCRWGEHSAMFWPEPSPKVARGPVRCDPGWGRTESSSTRLERDGRRQHRTRAEHNRNASSLPVHP